MQVFFGFETGINDGDFSAQGQGAGDVQTARCGDSSVSGFCFEAQVDAHAEIDGESGHFCKGSKDTQTARNGYADSSRRNPLFSLTHQEQRGRVSCARPMASGSPASRWLLLQ